MPSSLPERTLIWCEIKAAVPAMLKAGVSSVGVLVWSQGKSLGEVPPEAILGFLSGQNFVAKPFFRKSIILNILHFRTRCKRD